MIDNGTSAAALPALRKAVKRAKVRLIELGQNTGIAHAQNVGLRHAFAAGAEGAFLFDHDSVPQPGFAANMRIAYDEYLARFGQLAIVGSRVFDVNKREFARHIVYARFGFARRQVREGQTETQAMMAIASGTYLNRDVFFRVGEMREALFIDYVDWEYCLRAHYYSGIPTIICGDAVLEHARGVRTGKKVLGFVIYPPGYSAFRYRHIYRNRAIMLREYFFKSMAFVLFEVVSLVRDTLLIFAEPQSLRLLVVAVGAWLRGLVGRL